MKQKINIIIYALGVVSIAITTYIVLTQTSIIEDKLYQPILVGFLTLTLGAFSLQIIRTLRVNNKSLTISLLGFPQSGKTVYLTMLFNELQKIKTNTINFTPYGNETIEKVARDITTLQRGQWLPKTDINQFFYYRATTTLGEIIKKSYKLEIGDFAGERFEDLTNTNFNWLHRDKYFDYAIQSDAILLSLSAEIFGPNGNRNETINSVIASINILSQKKGYSDSEKMKEPICLIILKSDILEWEIRDKDYYLESINELLIVCNKRTKNFKYYFVTSVGKTIGVSPSKVLLPHNVIEPLIWLLRHEGK